MNRMKMKTEILPAEGKAIAKAADLLRRGELVALPTETVYGIAADDATARQLQRSLWPRAARRTTP